TSTRPEEEGDRGPDNLWDWAPVTWVVEAKSERGQLPKDDGEQALAAMQWFKDNYPERKAVPIVVSAVTECEWDASFPDDTRVVDDDGLHRMLDNIQAFVSKLVQMDPQDESQAERVKVLLGQHQLGQEQLLGQYSKKLGRRRRA